MTIPASIQQPQQRVCFYAFQGQTGQEEVQELIVCQLFLIQQFLSCNFASVKNHQKFLCLISYLKIVIFVEIIIKFSHIKKSWQTINSWTSSYPVCPQKAQKHTRCCGCQIEAGIVIQVQELSSKFRQWPPKKKSTLYIYKQVSLQKLQFKREMSDRDDDKHRRTVYVGNIPETVTQNDLYAFFNTFGEIISIDIPDDHITGKHRGFAFIQFDERQDANAAIDNYDKTQFMERNIKVRRSKPADSKPTYHKPVWDNDNWLTKIEQKKIQDQKYTLQMQQKNKALGLPIFKSLQKKQQKPVTYIEQQD